MTADKRTDTLIGQDLQQHRILDATIDDVHAVHAALRRVERCTDFRQHAPLQCPVTDQGIDFTRRQASQQLAFLIQNAGRVGQEYQLYLTTVLGRAITAVGDEEFVVGLDLSTNDSFVQPIRQELQTFEAGPEMHRNQKAGVYGWMEHGYAVLDNRRVLLATF